MNVFDRETNKRHKDISAQLPDQHVYDYLKQDVADRLADRLCDVLRHFPNALDIGAGKGYMARTVTKHEIGKLHQLESSKALLDLCGPTEVETENTIGDEEILPFEANTFDLIMSNLSLHWVNDLPGVFVQSLRCLKEDGVFIGSIFGSDTLYQLRAALQLAELEREGGFAPHISPFAEMKDIGGLLQRAGFQLNTVDYDEITIDYPSMFELMEDLKGMGESNAAWNRKSVLRRESLMAAAAIYKSMYGHEDGTIPATFQILYMIGWKPSKDTPLPLERGTGQFSLKDMPEVITLVEKELGGGDDKK